MDQDDQGISQFIHEWISKIGNFQKNDIIAQGRLISPNSSKTYTLQTLQPIESNYLNYLYNFYLTLTFEHYEIT